MLSRLTLVMFSVLVVVEVLGAAQAKGGTPISTCGQTVTTSAVLTQDLACTGDGIVVGAEGVTIDLKGFVIRGDRGSGDWGIDNSAGHDKLTVKNGVLRNFERGVYAGSGADKTSISNVIASGNSGYGIYVVGDSASVKSVTASGNSTGVYLEGDQASVKRTTAAGNTSYGIYLYGPSASIQSSIAVGNGRGIYVYGDSASVKGSTASGNTLYPSVSVGIHVDGNAASIKSSTASGNAAEGIYVWGDEASIQSSTAIGNYDHGIQIHGDAAKVKGNQTDGNGFAAGGSDFSALGIVVTDFTTAPEGVNSAHGNDDPVECNPASLC